MLHIAIVDDEKAHRDILSKYINEWQAKEGVEAEVKTFTSSEMFFFEWCENECYDVLFLDIMMSGISGIELAKKLRAGGKKVTIVFTTGITDYMQEGYEVEAMHYLLKPLEKDKVWLCLNKCRRQKDEQKKLMLVATEDGLMKVDVDGILYAEAFGHQCRLVCKNSTFQVKSGINEFARELDGEGDFLFCHRSYVVNVGKIAQISKTDIIMDNGAVIPVSRRQYAQVNQRFIASFMKRKNS